MQLEHEMAPAEAAWKPAAHSVQEAAPEVVEMLWLKPPETEKEPAAHEPAHVAEL